MRSLIVVLLFVAGAIGEDPDPDVGRFGYDCEVAYSHWRTMWNKDKQQWCCEYVHRGCVDTISYDCNEGRSLWMVGWSDDKKDWCCHHHHVGCPWKCPVHATEWSSRQHKEWCCKNHPPSGCTLEVVTTPMPTPVFNARQHIFDCGDQREPEWTNEKSKWCCEHDSRGCPYDCNIGTDAWVTRWSVHKKEYCCKKAPPRGCPGVEQYNCSAGIRQWRRGWSDGKKKWCCKHAGPRGCEEPYDCFTGLQTSEMAWSVSKKDWCCKHHHPNGCFNCLGGVANWREAWSDEKKQWCCAHKPPMGCETVADAYNCIESERHLWSHSEQKWCCSHGRTTLGCELRPDNYCSVNFKSRTWSHHRICYCCKHHGIACPPVYYPPHIPEDAIICAVTTDNMGMFEIPESQGLLITDVSEPAQWRQAHHQAHIWGRRLVAVPGAVVLLLLPLAGRVVLRRRGPQALFARELDDHHDALVADEVGKDIAEVS